MRLIIWSPEALGDLSDIGDYIEANASRTVAVRFLGRVRRYIRDQLAAFPGNRPECPELEPGLRRGVIGEYLIFYTFDALEIRIWRVLHGRRLISPRLFQN
jgi:plasmid stabilization system protein ParE